MKIIVGLGNPGKEYEKSRHNAGWMVLDELHKELNGEPFKEEKKFKALISDGSYQGQKMVLVKPLTFMNLSGEAVQSVAAFYKVQPEDVICAYDDLDTPFGSIRIKPKGGAGTHNGMKSMVQHLGQSFPRIRIGLRNENNTIVFQLNTDWKSAVLNPFNRSEKKELPGILKRSSEAIKTWITDGIEAAMNAFN